VQRYEVLRNYANIFREKLWTGGDAAAYSYLWRRYSRSKMERKKRNKSCFSFYFARLFVPLEKVLSLENGKEKEE